MKHLVKAMIIVPFLAVALAAQTQIVYIQNPTEVFKLFDEHGYTMQRWREGIRVVPRIYITTVPKRWQKNAEQMPVKKKKELFFRLLAPAVLHANEMVMHQRSQLEEIASKARMGSADKAWLKELAAEYGLQKETADAALIGKLLLRVDAVPVSLALAQSAEESGWGTSRFAVLGNSLFGQWDFSGKGMAPKEQRKALGDYGLARFSTPQDAVNAYLRNLNTHPAYRELRQKRAQMRADGRPLSGYELAKTLNKYSERGQAYIDTLHGIMKHNKLAATDSAYLWDKGDIMLAPIPSKK